VAKTWNNFKGKFGGAPNRANRTDPTDGKDSPKSFPD
jgi:hypothetical protein